MTQILLNTPVWVWPLLAILIAVGLRARHTRIVPLWLLYVLPVLALLPLHATASLGAGGWVWAVFTVAFCAGAGGGFFLQGRWLLGRVGTKLQLAGENITLVVLMVIFFANFVLGFLTATAPALAASPMFHTVFVVVIASCGGTFSGRALRCFVFVSRGGATERGR